MSDTQSQLTGFTEADNGESDDTNSTGDTTDSAATPPTPDSQPLVPPGEAELASPTTPPPKCLSFSITSPVAHFRKVETSQTQLTYNYPPRTTVAGLIAAIIGYDRDTYYQPFDLTHSAISVEITDPLRTMNLPVNHRTVDDSTLSTAKSGPLKIKTIDDEGTRQQVNHRVLRNPTYRIYVWAANTDVYSQLKTHLENGTAHYTPALGKSEYIATITYHGEFDTTPQEETNLDIDSIVPDSVGNPEQPRDAPLKTERTPAAMERITTPLPTRKTTTFETYYYRTDGDALTVDTTNAVEVDGRSVLFY